MRRLRGKINIPSIFLCLVLAVLFVFSAVFTAFFVEKKFVYPLYEYRKVNEYAIENELSVALVYSVIKTESGFKSDKISNKGAVGLMQIMPKTGEYIAAKLKVTEYDLKDREINIRFGCYYLKYLFDKFKNAETAICAYNAGEGRVEKWLKNSDYSIDGERLVSVPYKETREYLGKIKKSFKKYVKLHGDILDKKNIFE